MNTLERYNAAILRCNEAVDTNRFTILPKGATVSEEEAKEWEDYAIELETRQNG